MNTAAPTAAGSPKRARSRRPSDSLVRRARAVLEEAGLENAALVVAVSGGPDSLALLHALAGLQAPLGLSLTVAHLDHGLRPESYEDAQYVAAAARSLGLPCTIEGADVRAYQRERRLSLEQAAREVRYAFLSRAAREAGAAGVALGHTADDQAETVLLHLTRGSGLRGLAGMTPVTHHRGEAGQPPVTLVRPLLGVAREETVAFCQAKGLTPLQDATNSCLAIPRNYLRHEVLPRLAHLNPGMRDALGRLGKAAAWDVAYIEGQVAEAWPLIVHTVSNGLSLDRRELGTLHGALQRHLLRRAYATVHGNLEGLEQAHVEEMVRLLGGPAGAVMHLPRGVRWEVQPQYAMLTMGPSTCPLPALTGEHQVRVPGETHLGESWRVTTEDVCPSEPFEAAPFAAVLDREAIGDTLRVRARRRGDRFQPLGLGASEHSGAGRNGIPLGSRGKKLQDFMVNAGIPRSWRDRVPLLEGSEGVAWVVGWRIADWARVTSGTRRAVRLEFTPRN